MAGLLPLPGSIALPPCPPHPRLPPPLLAVAAAAPAAPVAVVEAVHRPEAAAEAETEVAVEEAARIAMLVHLVTGERAPGIENEEEEEKEVRVEIEEEPEVTAENDPDLVLPSDAGIRTLNRNECCIYCEDEFFRKINHLCTNNINQQLFGLAPKLPSYLR